MKKIVAISVMFALVAAAAFAQPTIGGQFKGGATLLSGSTGKDVTQDNSFYAGKIDQLSSDPDYPYKTELEKYDETSQDITAGQRQNDAWINAGFGDAEMGGKVRLNARANGDYYSPAAFAFMWWRPSELFRIQIGRNPDGDWGSAQITGWGFHGEAQDFVVIDKDSGNGLDTNISVARTAGFYGGISAAAILTSLYPIDGLTVNLGLPWAEASDRALDKWLRFHLQAKYDLEEVGSIFVTYEGQGQAQNLVKERFRAETNEGPYDADDNPLGNPGNPGKNQWFETDASKNWGAKTPEVDDYGKEVWVLESPKLFASFYGNKLVDGLAFDIGFGFQPQLKNGNTPPIAIGLGVSYNINEELNVKLRAGANLAGKSRDKYTAEAWERDTFAENKALIQSGIKVTNPVDGKVSDVETTIGESIGTKTETIKGQSKHGRLWSEDWATPTEIGVQILPSYKLSAFTFYFGAGLGFTFYPTDDGNPNRSFSGEERQKYANSIQDAQIARTKSLWAGGDADAQQAAFDAALYTPEAQSTAISWYINPYIRKSVNGASLMAGVKVWSSGKEAGKWKGKDEISWKDNGNPQTENNHNKDVKFVTNQWYRTINWAIPIGVNVYF